MGRGQEKQNSTRKTKGDAGDAARREKKSRDFCGVPLSNSSMRESCFEYLTAKFLAYLRTVVFVQDIAPHQYMETRIVP